MSRTNSFSSLSSVHLSSPGRLVQTACCPDKDLVIILTRLGGADRMSLWNLGIGSKIWEVDISGKDETTQVVGLTWSPNGQSIAVAHHPPRVTIHSLQDGHQELFIPVDIASTLPERLYRLLGIWWFPDEEWSRNSSIPDLLKRGDVITGTAHYILRELPLLDNLQDESEKSSATDLFAFQGSQTRSTPKASIPRVINSWPSLSLDPLEASIDVPTHKRSTPEGVTDGDSDASKLAGLLAVVDNHGELHFFIDGSFSIGSVSFGADTTLNHLCRHMGSAPRCTFHAHRGFLTNDGTPTTTELLPLVIQIPMLQHRATRDLAKLSSSARELMWYIMRVVREMEETWLGREGSTGARELGPKWIQAFEAKQRDQFGQEEPNAILDLTCLLATGRASESLLDFLGSGEQMSERGIQKWEAIMSEALGKLRDFSERRVVPACQRLHLVLEELVGWEKLPQNAVFNLSIPDLMICLDLIARTIIIANWLATVARRELLRFRHFILWLRFETNAAHLSNDNTATPTHDILEVNSYLMSGLIVSTIDKWFIGGMPTFTAMDLGVPGDTNESSDIPTIVETALKVANDSEQMAWQANVMRKDLSHLDRNLDASIQEVAGRCQRMFSRAAGAPCRSALVSFSRDSELSKSPSRPLGPLTSSKPPIRERIIFKENHELVQYTVVRWPEKNNCVFLTREHFQTEASTRPFEVGVALLECCLPEGEQQLDLDVLEVEFFDDDCVVIVYRLRSGDKPAFVATVTFHDLAYQAVELEGYVKSTAREDLMQNALKRLEEEEFHATRTPIQQCHALAGCKAGGVSLAVNGRVGRRVACVLDSLGTSLESFDLEGEMDAMDDGGHNA